ncbi:ATP-binding protein [Cerasicoccus maritimus]|uniref:ATP-binding protein n=1 Tax=Cerasicoccus maritimus TaxID=490089 RepID=UPI0028525D6D|nr:ATP-binding protein [Cerasicoccus maritimus]
MSEELRRMCQRLRPLIGDGADALWTQYSLAETPVQKMEAANLIQLMGLRHLGSGASDAKIWLTPPSASFGDLYLGEALYPGRPPSPLRLKRKDLTRHMGVFATTGSGKTNIAYHLLIQLSKQGVPWLAIDWKRSYRNLKQHVELRNLKVYTVGRYASPLAWNPLRPPPGVHPHTWIQILAEILEKTHVSGQGVADVLIEHMAREFELREKDNLDEAARSWPNLFDVRGRVERARYSGRQALWRDSALRILRTFTFGPAAASFNSRQPIHLETLLEQPVVLELDQELPRNVRTFFSEAILRWIHLYRLGQGETSKLRHVLILEEAHNIFPRVTEAGLQGGLENLYREIRSFGQGLISITQHPSLLPIYVLGNTHSLIFLSLTHEADIIAARQALFLPRGSDQYLDRLKRGEGIIKIKERTGPCHVRFPHIKVKAGAIRDEDLTA